MIPSRDGHSSSHPSFKKRPLSVAVSWNTSIYASKCGVMIHKLGKNTDPCSPSRLSASDQFQLVDKPPPGTPRFLASPQTQPKEKKQAGTEPAGSFLQEHRLATVSQISLSEALVQVGPITSLVRPRKSKVPGGLLVVVRP